MGSITGKSLIVAVEETTSTWGTLVAVGATDQVLCSQIGPLIDKSDMIPDPTAGHAWHQYIERCRKNVKPELILPLRWDGRFWSLIAQIMGLDSKSGSADPYTHLITLIESIDGSDLFSAMAAQLGPAGGELLFEWPSIKPYGFTIEGPDGSGYMQLTIRMVADRVNVGADCTTTTSNIDNVTHISLDSALPPIVPFGNMRFRMNARSGSALGAGDVIKIKSMNLTFNRGIDAEWNTRGVATKEWESDEPIEDGIPEGTLRIELGDLNALTYLEAFQDETEQKCDLFFTYDADHDINIEIPCMKLIDPDASINGPARIPQVLNFQLMESLANPTGMAFNNWQITARTETAIAYE
jgi:hypothetical protein